MTSCWSNILCLSVQQVWLMAEWQTFGMEYEGLLFRKSTIPTNPKPNTRADTNPNPNPNFGVWVICGNAECEK